MTAKASVAKSVLQASECKLGIQEYEITVTTGKKAQMKPERPTNDSPFRFSDSAIGSVYQR